MPAHSIFHFGSADPHLSVLYVPWRNGDCEGKEKKKSISHNNVLVW